MMRLSPLQHFILLEGYVTKGRLPKSRFFVYYEGNKNPPRLKDQHGILDKSIDRLVQKGMLRAHGIKTAEKWIVAAVSLTRAGRERASELIRERGRLPLPKRKKAERGH